MGVVEQRPIRRGYGSADRPQMRELWQNDSYGTVGPMSATGTQVSENEKVDYQRYYSPEWAKAEIEHVWRKSWLFAGREEDIPEVGDRAPFDVGSLSFLIVRSGENEIKAFYNSCLHRGTALCTKKGSGESLKCPYHGWEWKVDGSLRRVPGHWDFPGVNKENASLPEVKVGRWGGFIFINADPNAASFEEAIGVIPEHFKHYDLSKRYTASRFRKLVAANWKVSQEAFQESYHLSTTHPMAVGFNGDTQTDYDLWSTEHGHIGRQCTPSAVPSMNAPSSDTLYTAAQIYVQVVKEWHFPDADPIELDPNGNLRAQIADWHRREYKKLYGRELDAPDTVVIDSPLYFIFPHACLWMSETIPFTYCFTPHATDPELSYFEVRLMKPWPEGESRPPAAELIEIGLDEDIFNKAPAFGFLGVVFMEDMSNVPLVQKGVKAANPNRAHTILGRYQEGTIRHWHAVMDKMIGDAL